MAAGDMEAAEVVQVFVSPSTALLESTTDNALPQRALKGFTRVVLKPGQHKIVQLPLTSKDFQYAAAGQIQNVSAFVIPS